MNEENSVKTDQNTKKGSAELKQRVIAGLAGLGIILGALFWHPWSYFSIFLLISLITQREFYQLTGLRKKQDLQIYGIVLGAATNVLIFLYFYNPLPVAAVKFYILVFPALFAAFLLELYRKNNPTPFQDLGWWFLGIMYIAVPFALLHFVAFYVPGKYSPTNVLGVLFLIWANDIGAYFTGKAFGKHSLFPRISPKKTWEGSIGGMVTALLVAILLSFIFNGLQAWQWLGIVVIVILAGTSGDLIESMFKRSIHIKDSGSTIPGHGGFLDRFDALLMAIPFIVAFLQIF
ncbi:phosphatidate cytidylyltransferase [uncultured Microscilla sp.]|uniref:phosphatidate cytidylyltransferase n=1 Tax=uncultured Microscilla sp. TaxID=432653 RepID=UPI00261F6ACA|nr:phosphatidate cytidylyltransferase [uncultured Microscilla sp.]